MYAPNPRAGQPFFAEPQDLTPETDLYEDLGADELDATELAWNVGEGIGREVPAEDMAACQTVDDVWRYICENTWHTAE